MEQVQTKDEKNEQAPRPIQSYRDLQVWQQEMDLATLCYQGTCSFPKEELYAAVMQIRKSAASVPENIAEGHGRENRGEFVQFLRIAQGSLKELETHVLLSQRVGLATRESVRPILDRCEIVKQDASGADSLVTEQGQELG